MKIINNYCIMQKHKKISYRRIIDNLIKNGICLHEHKQIPFNINKQRDGIQPHLHKPHISFHFIDILHIG